MYLRFFCWIFPCRNVHYYIKKVWNIIFKSNSFKNVKSMFVFIVDDWFRLSLSLKYNVQVISIVYECIMLCNEYVKADNKLVFNLSSLTFIFLAFSLRRDLFFPIYDWSRFDVTFTQRKQAMVNLVNYLTLKPLNAKTTSTTKIYILKYI